MTPNPEKKNANDVLLNRKRPKSVRKKKKRKRGNVQLLALEKKRGAFLEMVNHL